MSDISRIKVFDSLRVIAILMVFCHHYYGAGVFPELGKLFYFGSLGVPLFFIISGFVIIMTLERTPSFPKYLKNRFIRLSPAMLICSSLTFIFFCFFYKGDGYEHSKNLNNLLIANTFIDPHVFNLSSGRIKYYYMDNAYWSLWVEICFYTIIGLFYYFNRNKYILYYIILCVVGMPIYLLFYSSTGHNVMKNFMNEDQLWYFKLIARCFALFNECLWFLVGIFLYKLFNSKDEKKYLVYILAILFVTIIKERTIEMIVFSIVVFAFIYIFTYKPKYLKFLEQPFMLEIGVASYAMYLIHYHLGVVFIRYLDKAFGLGYWGPILTIFLVILFGLACYKFLEKRLIALYKKVLIK